ncbi:unnamed protein product [Leuciscus chuanchicus]
MFEEQRDIEPSTQRSESFGSRTAHFSPPALSGAHREPPRAKADQPRSEVTATARASFVSLTATERAPGLDLRVGKSDSPHFESRGKGASSSVRQSSSGKAFQSFVIHFGMPPLTSLWTCLALQGNGEGSRAFCIVVRGKQGSDSHDRHSPRSGRGEDPAQSIKKPWQPNPLTNTQPWRFVRSRHITPHPLSCVLPLSCLRGPPSRRPAYPMLLHVPVVKKEWDQASPFCPERSPPHSAIYVNITECYTPWSAGVMGSAVAWLHLQLLRTKAGDDGRRCKGAGDAQPESSPSG